MGDAIAYALIFDCAYTPFGASVARMSEATSGVCLPG